MLDLLDYRRRVSEMYASIRRSSDPAEAWQLFRRTRDRLLKTHPQSPLDAGQRETFSGLRYADYDPEYRIATMVDYDVEPIDLDYDLGYDGRFHCTRFGQVPITLPTGSAVLSLYWITGYGGGVFLPFGDLSNRRTSYGGGRYLIDTIKGADLGAIGEALILDFNFAYNPSCAYNPRWICPLAPPENKLPFNLPVGELKYGK